MDENIKAVDRTNMNEMRRLMNLVESIERDGEILEEGIRDKILGAVAAAGIMLGSNAQADTVFVYADESGQLTTVTEFMDVPDNAQMAYALDTETQKIKMIKSNSPTQQAMEEQPVPAHYQSMIIDTPYKDIIDAFQYNMSATYYTLPSIGHRDFQVKEKISEVESSFDITVWYGSLWQQSRGVEMFKPYANIRVINLNDKTQIMWAGGEAIYDKPTPSDSRTKYKNEKIEQNITDWLDGKIGRHKQ